MDKKPLSRPLFFFLSFLMLFTAAIWGFSFVVVKDSLNQIGAVWMIAYRFSIAAIFLSLIYCKRLKALSRKTILHGFLLGVYLFLAYLLQTIGCKYTTAGKNAFFTTIYVFLCPLFLLFIMKLRPHYTVFIAAILALVGLALLSLGGGSVNSFNRGDFLTILCGIFFALHMAYGKCYTQKDDPILLSVLQFITSALLGFICAPLLDGMTSSITASAFNHKVIYAMLYLGIFSTMIGFVLQNIGLKYLPSSFASLLLSFESVFGALFGVILLKEVMSFPMIIGCIFMFSSLVVSQLKE